MSLKENLLGSVLSAAYAMTPVVGIAEDPQNKSRFTVLKETLGIDRIQQGQTLKNPCHLYIVHHGDTAYTVLKRLQGWNNTPLNEEGKQQMEQLAKRLSPITNVVLVTHGGNLKFLNFLLGNYTPEKLPSVSHGDLIRVDGDGTTLALSKIWEIDTLDAIWSEVDKETSLLLDLDETLIETPTMLGGKAWRSYAATTLKKQYSSQEAAKIKDKITHYIATHVRYKAVEPSAPASLKKAQEQGVSIFGFTARGKNHWYDLPIQDAQNLTFKHLKDAGFDLSEQSEAPLFSHWSYAQKVFFAYPMEDKGDLVRDLNKNDNFRPSKLVFVDDKKENCEAVQRACEELGIPVVCFYYRHIELHRPFDPMTAYIQLKKLFFDNEILSDDEAAHLKTDYSPDANPETLFLELIAEHKKKL